MLRKSLTNLGNILRPSWPLFSSVLHENYREINKKYINVSVLLWLYRCTCIWNHTQGSPEKSKPQWNFFFGYHYEATAVRGKWHHWHRQFQALCYVMYYFGNVTCTSIPQWVSGLQADAHIWGTLFLSASAHLYQEADVRVAMWMLEWLFPQEFIYSLGV